MKTTPRFTNLTFLLGALFLSSVLSAFGATSYTIAQVTFGALDHRAPSINNKGEVVWMENVPVEGFQIVSSTRGKLTSPDATYSTAQYPSLADNGDFICFRPTFCVGNLVRYPGGGIVDFCSRNGLSHRDPIKQSGVSSDGKIIWGREFYSSGFLSTRKFFVNGVQVPGDFLSWNNPAMNASGEYVYDRSQQVISSTRGFLASGQKASINDNGDVVFEIFSQIFVHRLSGEDEFVAVGNDPSINSDGVIAFERSVNGYYHIITATPASDLRPTNLKIHYASGEISFAYKIIGPDLTIDPSVEFWWASGKTLNEKLALAGSKTYSLPDDRLAGEHAKTLLFPGPDILPAPNGALYLLAVTDPADDIAESDESNNVLAAPVVDVVGTSLTSKTETFTFAYDVLGAAPAIDCKVTFYWATGTSLETKLSEALGTNVPASSGALSLGAHTLQVASADLAVRPDTASHLLALIDSDNAIEEADEDNNLASVALLLLEIVDPNSDLLDSNGRIIPPTSLLGVNKLSRLGTARERVAADGLTPLVLRCRSDEPVTFSILSQDPVDVDGALLDFGVQGPATSIAVNPVLDADGTSWAFAAYIAPQFTSARTFQIQASRGTESFARPLSLEPPPVVLVHGIWSGPEAWTEGGSSPGGLKAALENAGYKVTLANYSDHSADDFNPNIPRPGNVPVDRVAQAIGFAVAAARGAHIAATQVDVIAHSLGGVVTRAFIAQPGYERIDNFMEGDIHKIITVGTPHFGTPIATWGIQNKCSERVFRTVDPVSGIVVDTQKQTLEEFFAQTGRPLGAAMYAVQTNGRSIVRLGQTMVPTHAIVGIEPSLSPLNPFSLENILDAVAVMFTGQIDMVDSVLGGEKAHDAFISKYSAMGGLPGGATTEIQDIDHLEETGSPVVYSAILSLLVANVHSTKFGEIQALVPNGAPLDPFACPASPSFAGPTIGGPQLSSQAEDASVQVVFTPNVGAIFAPGERVAFDISILGGSPIHDVILFVGNGVFQASGASPYHFEFDVPVNTVGRIPTELVAFGPVDNYLLRSWIIIQTGDNIIDIQASPNQLQFAYLGQDTALLVTGSYASGGLRNITDSTTGTTYSTQSGNNAVFSVTSDGLVVAKGNGEDVLHIANGSAIADVLIRVNIRNDIPVLANPGDQAAVVGSAIDVPLSASDPNGDAIHLSLISAPSFVSVNDNGNGTGTLHVAPGPQDTGTKSAVLTAVDSGTPSLGATVTFAITVTSLPGDLDNDGDVDKDDLNIILAARNTPASGPDDPRDLDKDGMITALDARKLTTLFTRPGGATK